MAEVVAVVGLISAIVQFIDFGTEVVARLQEFDTDTKEVPKSFQDLKLDLPVIISMLKETQKIANAGDISREDEGSLESSVVG
jgi:hypothetical protein